MKKILWVCFALYTFLPIQGQEKAVQSNAAEDSSNDSNQHPFLPVAPTSSSGSKGNEQHTKANPKGYLSELVAPNNLPNLLLVLVGIGAIIYAAKTVSATEEAAEATRDAAKASADQAKIAREALIAQFRPKLRVRAIKLLYPDESVSITVHIVNIGGTRAQVVRANVETSWLYTSKWSNDNRISDTKSVFQPFLLEAGEPNVLPIPCEDSRVVIACAKSVVDAGQPQNQFLICTGEIEYADDNGTRRLTAFRRTYQFGTDRFIADPDPEYEYED